VQNMVVQTPPPQPINIQPRPAWQKDQPNCTMPHCKVSDERKSFFFCFFFSYSFLKEAVGCRKPSSLPKLRCFSV
jgi:hypothetical protein